MLGLEARRLYEGFKKGIQGHLNSCYLDASLFRWESQSKPQSLSHVGITKQIWLCCLYKTVLHLRRWRLCWNMVNKIFAVWSPLFILGGLAQVKGILHLHECLFFSPLIKEQLEILYTFIPEQQLDITFSCVCDDFSYLLSNFCNGRWIIFFVLCFLQSVCMLQFSRLGFVLPLQQRWPPQQRCSGTAALWNCQSFTQVCILRHIKRFWVKFTLHGKSGWNQFIFPYMNVLIWIWRLVFHRCCWNSGTLLWWEFVLGILVYVSRENGHGNESRHLLLIYLNELNVASYKVTLA